MQSHPLYFMTIKFNVVDTPHQHPAISSLACYINQALSAFTARPHINQALICEFHLPLWGMCRNMAWRMVLCAHEPETWEVCIIPRY